MFRILVITILDIISKLPKANSDDLKKVCAVRSSNGKDKYFFESRYVRDVRCFDRIGNKLLYRELYAFLIVFEVFGTCRKRKKESDN